MRNENMKYLSPRTDVGFKKLFGSKDHKKLTIDFLNCILDRKEGNLIEKIDFAETEQLPEFIDGRKSFFDIYCTDQDDNKFIIEMQRKYQSHFMVRAQYYTGLALYRQMMNPPFKYEKLLPVIFIAVLDHVLFDKLENDIITLHTLMDMKHNTISSFHQTYHIVELPKFKKTIDQLHSPIDEWLFFMNNAEDCKKIPEEMEHSEKFQEAFHILERMYWTERELDQYLAEADWAGREDRIEQGALERGEEKGLQKGIQQGVQQGMHEKAADIAINLLKKGIDLDIIVDATGLSIEEIENLRKNYKQGL